MRRIIPRVVEFEIAGRRIQNGEKHRNEHQVVVVLRELAVDAVDDVGRGRRSAVTAAHQLGAMRTRALIRAMYRAAVMPLPDTSPIRKQSRPSASVKKS